MKIGGVSQPAVDPAQLGGKTCQTRGNLGADVLGHADVVTHLLMHGFAYELQRPHGPSGDNRDRIIVLDQHGELSDQGAGLYGLGINTYGPAANADGVPGDDHVGSIAPYAGVNDDLTGTKYHALRPAGDLGDLQRPQPLKDLEPEKGLNECIDCHDN